MTTRILLAPIKVSIGLVKLELRIVRSVARLAFELGRESARGESHDNGAAAEAAPEPASPAAVADEPVAPRAARTTRSAARPRGATTSRKPAARKPATTRRPAAPRRPPDYIPLVGTWVRYSLLRNGFSVQPPDAPLYVKFMNRRLLVDDGVPR